MVGGGCCKGDYNASPVARTRRSELVFDHKFAFPGFCHPGAFHIKLDIDAKNNRSQQATLIKHRRHRTVLTEKDVFRTRKPNV